MEEIPYWPKNSTDLPPGAQGYSVLDHLRVAFYHLNNSVGLGMNEPKKKNFPENFLTGEHGLLKIGDGDWDDGKMFNC